MEFICDPPMFARYVSVDMDPTRPGARSPPGVMIAELEVTEYVSGECSSSSSTDVTGVFQQTTVSTPAHQTTKDNKG